MAGRRRIPLQALGAMLALVALARAVPLGAAEPCADPFRIRQRDPRIADAGLTDGCGPNRLCGFVTLANELERWRGRAGGSPSAAGSLEALAWLLSEVGPASGVGTAHARSNGLLIPELAAIARQGLGEALEGIEVRVASPEVLLSANVPENGAVSELLRGREASEVAAELGARAGLPPQLLSQTGDPDRVRLLLVGRWPEGELARATPANRAGAHWVAVRGGSGEEGAFEVDDFNEDEPRLCVRAAAAEASGFAEGATELRFEPNPDPGMRHLALGWVELRLRGRAQR